MYEYIDMPKGKSTFDLLTITMDFNEMNQFKFIEDKNITEDMHKAFDQTVSNYQKEHNCLREDNKEFCIYAEVDSKVVGGILGDFNNDYLYIDELWVDTKHRGIGVGKELMKYAEGMAIDRGITYAHLGTGDFQARSFYEKLGYEVVVTYQDVPIGHENYTMVKKLK
jgi:GNAT superfamily N-acetyltransferase